MLKVIQVGYGYWGSNITKKLIESADFEIIGLCETDEKRRTRASELLPKEIIINDDYEIYLENSEIEAFVIATQTELSFEIACKAMAAGKHIFIEKPIATTVERANKLKEIAEQKGVLIHCDHIMLFHPVIRYIKKMIENKELGPLLYIDVSRLNLGPVRRDVNVMLDLAVHDLAVIDYLAKGEDVVRLSAIGESTIGKQETLTYLTIQYKSFLAHIKSSWVSPVKERRTIIAGAKKMLIFDDIKSNKLEIYNCGLEVEQGTEYGKYEFLVRTGDIYIPNIPFEDSLKNSLEYFANCVHTGKESISGAIPSIRVLKILETAIGELQYKRGDKNGAV